MVSLNLKFAVFVILLAVKPMKKSLSEIESKLEVNGVYTPTHVHAASV